jgi:hypothetical protein
VFTAVLRWSAPGGAPRHHALVWREGYWLWLSGMTLVIPGGWRRGGDNLSRTEAAKLARLWDD